ncbi:MCE family protein [Streptomyces sp. NBC_01387]|uniref:MCE family protein n=1 Tax=unclassified Streptomyces TaxID=2593676 RepID=UPI0020252123|nr:MULTISPECIES: MCE family protein [unclassified Streptomyces]MCX4553821.1 MCE family protein [Streptomyces sp. NBC_01500]WSC18735.1 MCE family protein [Streptomyces sp. NBC_01766]WSV52769.1 MCE family protein [Streptomyces sp. NBC_01014]
MKAPRGRIPRLKPVRDRNPVAVSLVGLLVLALIGLAAYRADSLPFIGGGTTYTADFSESAGLSNGDEVRIAGVKVGKVTGVGLDGPKVKVTFKVKDAWVGNSSTAAIAIKTLLGDKYLALDPVGTGPQDPSSRIPLSRTTSPYDVTQAFSGLSDTIGEIDTKQLAKSFETISATFKNSPPDVKTAADGLSALSKTVSERDTELAKLLKGSKQLTKTLSGQNSSFDALLKDGNLLLGEIQNRRDSIHLLLTGTTDLGTELTGLVKDNNKQLQPTLTALNNVTTVLLKNRKSLDKALSLAGPYYRLVGNTLGNGRWFDSYICGLVPKNYLPAGTPPDTGCMSPQQTSGGSR